MLKKYFYTVFALLYCLTFFSKTSAIIEVVVKNNTKETVIIYYKQNAVKLEKNTQYIISPVDSAILKFNVRTENDTFGMTLPTKSFYPSENHSHSRTLEIPNGVSLERNEKQEIIAKPYTKKGETGTRLYLVCQNYELVTVLSPQNFILNRSVISLTRKYETWSKIEYYKITKVFNCLEGIKIIATKMNDCLYGFVYGLPDALLEYPCIREKIESDCPQLINLAKGYTNNIILCLKKKPPIQSNNKR